MSSDTVFLEAAPFEKTEGHPEAIEKFNVITAASISFFRDNVTEPELVDEFKAALRSYREAVLSEDSEEAGATHAVLYFCAGKAGLPATKMPEFIKHVNLYTNVLAGEILPVRSLWRY